MEENEVSSSLELQDSEIQPSINPEEHINLGNSFRRRFEHTGDLTNVSKPISSHQKAVDVTPEGHADMPRQPNNLGISFPRRFKRTGDLTDISEAISYYQKAVDLTPEGHADMPSRLTRLGNLFLSRFELTGDLTDISEAISYHQKAVDLTPEGHEDMPNRVTSLGNWFLSRFERTGDLTDISKAISSRQKVVDLTPEGYAYMPGWLNSLGNSFRHRFSRTGDLTDADMPGQLNKLGLSFLSRFEHTGNLTDISEAISSRQKAVDLTPEGHADMPGRLTSLGNSFLSRFECTGDLTDISKAISSHQKAVDLTPEGHASMPSWLNSLGNSFRRHVERTGDVTDISEAISSLQKAVDLTPESYAGVPGQMAKLGYAFQRRSDRTGDFTDADMPGQLYNLGLSFLRRFKRTGDLTDISDAISSHQKAVDLTPKSHANMPRWLNSLGYSLQRRFERTGDLSDISKAISSHQKAVDLTPEGHGSMPFWLNSLGDSFQCCFERTENPPDIQRAIFNYRLSATYCSGPPSVRLHGAMRWAHWSQLFDPSQLLEAYRIAVPLVSQVAGLEQTIQQRYINLRSISELSTSAAATAFRFEQHHLALEWLELGRCLVWSQLNNLRTPLDDLCTHNPAIAEDIVRVSRALQNAGSRAEPSTFTAKPSTIQKISMQDEATAHVKLAQEWDQLLTNVRAMPHFEDFLKPASCSTLLKHIPHSGPVVVINIHKDRSDALVLVSGKEEPLHIALHEFSYVQADNLRNSLKAHLLDSGLRMRGSETDMADARGMRSKRYPGVIKDVLHQLWVSVVKPILDGLRESDSPSNISRIWWCVTGPLAFLPIHAAGIYAPTESTPGIYSTLSDFAVSSYTPTVRALIERVQSPRENDEKKMGLFMISQPDTPNLRRIPGTTKEVRAIEQLMKHHNFRHLCLESDAATVNQAITNMKAHSCIHFACHAAQNTDEPLQSGFYLHDRQLNLLSIIKEQLVGADLAFLSACQTCAGDEKLSEEAVHLAAGMLAAGYRGVVATMWSIEDRHGPKIAEDFYKNLVGHGAGDKKGSEGLSSDSAALALHYATQQIRKTLGDSESSLLTWVPYVHFGL